MPYAYESLGDRLLRPVLDFAGVLQNVGSRAIGN
jgi:hypothetical protein